MKIVDVDHLSFEYGNRRVLHNLNFSIRQGDYAVLTGENGSGCGSYPHPPQFSTPDSR